MNATVKEKCELLSTNKSIIHRSFLFEKEQMSAASALIFTSAGKEADIDKMKSCRKLLKKNTRPLSSLRDIVDLVLLSKMTLADDPEKYLNDFMSIYEKIMKGSLLENDYMALSAILIMDFDLQNESDEIVERAKELMKKMNSAHPILTAADDISFVMFLAISGKSAESVFEDLEEGYKYLKDTCKPGVSSDAMYELCEVLAMTYGDMRDKCDKVMRIYNVLKKYKSDFISGSGLSELGTLIDTDLEPEEIANEIIEANNSLKELKGFKDPTCDKNLREMYASMIVADVYGANKSAAGNSIISNTMALIRAQQIAKMISFVSSTAPTVVSAFLKTDDDPS